MHKLSAAFITVALATGATLMPTPALAATGEFGNTCVATSAPSNATVINIANAVGSPLPSTAPASGVITKATTTLPAGPFAFPSKLKVARGTGLANQYTVRAESTGFTIGGGTQSFAVRVPVTAGDLIGLGGTTALSCSSAGSSAATLASDAAVGSPLTYTPAANTSVPLVATIEPDADHDGFGDVTQDLCPSSAAIHTQCPVIDSFAASSGNQITVLVTSSGATNVKVTGLAKVNGKKIKLKGGTHPVKLGAFTQFKVKIPASLRSALAGLPAAKSIKVKLTATSSIPSPHSTDKSSVKLHGTRH